MKAVSVILCARNAEATIDRALDSIRAQTFQDWELLVINDGSTDATGDRIEQQAAIDGRIRPLHQEPLGIVPAFEHGRKQSTGRLIARMDADDEMLPERLQRQVDYLQQHPDIGLVSCKVHYGGDRTGQQGYARYVDWVNGLQTPEQIALRRFIESPIVNPAVCFRAELIDQYGSYRDGDFPEDYELWLRWLDAGVRCYNLPVPLMRWNDLPSRQSRTNPRYRVEAFYKTKNQYLAKHLQRNFTPLPPIWLWGSGRVTRKRFADLKDLGIEFAGYVDVDPDKCGQIIDGLPVVFPEHLLAPGSAFVLAAVGSWSARERIQSWLDQHGWVEGRHYLLVA